MTQDDIIMVHSESLLGFIYTEKEVHDLANTILIWCFQQT